MKPTSSRVFPVVLATLVFVVSGFGAPAPAPSLTHNPASHEMVLAYLKREAQRLDAKYLEGVTNLAQWEARRGGLREQYLEMLGLWPLPERTPLAATTTGVLERDEGFRVEKVGSPGTELEFAL